LLPAAFVLKVLKEVLRVESVLAEECRRLFVVVNLDDTHRTPPRTASPAIMLAKVVVSEVLRTV
jgi:hypothetical protein